MTKPKRPTVRVFVEEDLAEGQSLILPEGPSHYLRNVMRKSEGAEIGLFNGRSPEFRTTLSKVGKKAVEVEVHDVVLPFEPLQPLTLLFSPIKRTPMELLIAKATELGVTAFQPVLMDHTQSERMKTDRLISIAIEAAEQCERLTVPDFLDPLPMKTVVEQFEGKIGAAFETSAFRPAREVLEGIGTLGGLMIGPEGGFSPNELAWLGNQGHVCGLSLGPRILKAETAGIALLSLYQALNGDWIKLPDFRGPE